MTASASCSFYSPLGYISCEASSKGLTVVKIISDEVQNRVSNDFSHPILSETKKQLEAYFAGTRHHFELELDFGEASPFFKSVWEILIQIPYGHTRSYGDIAKELGDINKSRAVGMANGRNPIPIIVPCHRVVGSDHSLTGYAYGLDVKRKLLELESPARWSVQSELSF